MFSPGKLLNTDTTLPRKPKRNCPARLTGSECFWYKDQSAFGTKGCQNMVSHQMNQTLYSIIPPLSLYLWQKFSPILHCRAEGNNCLLLKAQNHKSEGFSGAPADPLCAGTLSSTHPTALWPAQERGYGTDTTCVLGTRKLIKSQGWIQCLVLNFSGISHISIYMFTVHEFCFPLSFSTKTLDKATSARTHTAPSSCR